MYGALCALADGTPTPKSIFHLYPMPWPDYELIDAGNLQKLERFGPHIVRRPEPQAIWPATLPEAEWQRLAEATFARQQGQEEKGSWSRKPGTPERWWITYGFDEGTAQARQMRLKISLSSFKHVGVFPEQAENWEFIYEQGQKLGPGHAVLNLFAYTGGASLAARLAGAEVTHIDSMKPTLSWASENAAETGVVGIRWICDDALAFARREQRRGKKYQGLILDPPAYGRGPKGEKWLLEEGINPLLEACAELVDPVHGYVILNLYSLGYSPLIARNLGRRHFLPHLTAIPTEHYGELRVGEDNLLPLGTCWRVAF